MELFKVNLKKEREFCGLTQKEMADRLGILLTRYKKYESLGRGSRTPDLEMICQIADVLGVSVDELLGRK